jgi:hypothetical protein
LPEASAVKDRDVLFHERWLGLVQPVEGLVFSVPVLADAQIAPELRTELTSAFQAHLAPDEPPRIVDVARFFRELLGYDRPGMLVPRAELPPELSFYAGEGGQELRPSFALGRGPFMSDDPFAAFEAAPPKVAPVTAAGKPSDQWFALIWDLTESGQALDLDAPEAVTGPWRYPPTAKLERLLRHVGIPVGLIFNGRELRLVYAPSGESTAHLTFRVEHLQRPDGRPVLAALDLLLHARRAYGASSEHTLEGLLAESRRRQADVTDELAKQVFEAVEILVAGFEEAAARDVTGDRVNWLSAALEEEGDHFYQGVLSVVLRLVFLLYAEDQSLLPVEHPSYAEHLSLFGLHQRLSHDAGAHPESMHHRFGAYGQLLSLFRSLFFGVKHGSLELPPRHGRLFDPNAYPFLEGGLPGWTAAVVDPAARALAQPPSLDDGTIYRVLHRLVVFEGQRLSYRTLDVEQIGSIYESLMGYHVLRLTSPAVRLGKFGIWVESEAVRAMPTPERVRFLKEVCGLNPGPVQALEKALKETKDDVAAVDALAAHAVGRKSDTERHRAEPSRLVLQPGEERRRTASHYTPRSLTEKVVRRTLEPLLACLGPERTPEQILELKICDPATGSGAFLVATCRELASEIVAAWTRRGELARVIEQHADAHLYARRLVAQKCLYGVDKNAAAVELAKLSLWLITLSKQLPFTFVDHALRHGDSLVGLDFKQIEAFHWSPPGQVETCRVLLREALDQAVGLRQQILDLADREDPVSQGEKRRLLEFSQQAIGRVRVVADACVGAFFTESKDAARERERKRRLTLVERWLGGDVEAGAEVEGLAAEARKRLAPFHWWVEFPEVFFDERPDPLQGGAINGAALMEGVVGNPPFAGKDAIKSAYPSAFLDWLKEVYPGDRGVRGNCDLSAFFFRRAAMLLGEHGALGLVATNTIAQGDTRSIGLKHMLSDGWVIFDVTSDLPWAGAAAVMVSLVEMAHGRATQGIVVRLDGKACRAISSRFQPTAERVEAVRLCANSGFASQGGVLLGEGFILSPDERDQLVAANPENALLIEPYIGGQEVNSNPTQNFERFVVNFGQRTLEDAGRWPDLLHIVRERVKPVRDQMADHSAGRQRRKYWWRFAGSAPELYAALNSLARCLVTARVTKHLCFSFQPTDRTFNEKLYVFPLDHFTAFAVLQSRIHVPWVWLLSSTMKMDLNYSASDCFETFPFPKPDPRAVLPELETAGQALYDARAAYMVETHQGLTKTYNALKDPACDDSRILELRRLHEAMDRAVLDAYGWTDIAVPPYCPTSDADRAALQAFEDEVIDRLYVLNAERAREEERLGLAGRGRKAGSATPNQDGALANSVKNKGARTPRAREKTDGQTVLFGIHQDEGKDS